MPTQKQLQAANLYVALMEEVKLRIEAINAGTGGMVYALPPPIVREHCFLQIRFICELVALGCLVAHGDIKAADKLRGKWNADEIMRELEKLHPDFYPFAMRQDGQHNLDAVNPSPLPKAELLKLYHKCGDVLHRGSMKKLLSQKTPLHIHYPDITALAQKLNDLLQCHLVVMLGGDTVFICVLRNRDDPNLRAHVAIAERRLLGPSGQMAGGGAA
jgi:hypothetical protein